MVKVKEKIVLTPLLQIEILPTPQSLNPFIRTAGQVCSAELLP